MILYAIRNWEKHFENNRTKELKHLAWVPMPNKMDGDGYTQLLNHKNGAAHFGAWCALVEVASRCDPRGVLSRNGAIPHDPASLERITRILGSVWEQVLPRLVTIGWLISSDISQDDAGISHDSAVLLNGNEQKGKKEHTPTPPFSEIQAAWNEQAKKIALPQCRDVSEKRKRAIEQRWTNTDWQENWKVALDKIGASTFLRGGGKDGWKANFDWFIKPDSVNKILEGAYDGKSNSFTETQKTEKSNKPIIGVCYRCHTRDVTLEHGICKACQHKAEKGPDMWQCQVCGLAPEKPNDRGFPGGTCRTCYERAKGCDKKVLKGGRP